MSTSLALVLAIQWAAYYAEAVPPGGFAGFNLLVLDSDFHPELKPLIQSGKTVLGYISIGEVEDVRTHFKEVKAEGLLRGENPNWKGSHFVDVRDRRWRNRVKALVREILKKGFHGVFLDTVDDAEFLEQTEPAKNKGMNDAMATLVIEVRKEFPGARIAVNRGYSILPKIAGSIDYVLGECVLADYDFQAKTYRRVPQELYKEQVQILQSAQRQNPNLTVLTLDYWDPRDTRGIAQIYSEQRRNGFQPYVATIELDRLIPEPRH